MRHRRGGVTAVAVAAIAAIAERRAVPRNEQPHTRISVARRSELAGSMAAHRGARHTGLTRPRCGTCTYHGSKPVAWPSSE